MENLNLSPVIIKILIFAIGGGLASLLGWALGYLVPRQWKRKTIQPILLAAFIVGSLPVSQAIGENFEKGQIAKEATAKIMQNPFYTVLIKQHPEIEEKIEGIIADALSQNLSGQQISDYVQAHAGQLIGPYYLKHLVTASTAAIGEHLEHVHQIFLHMKNNPRACMAYFAGGLLQPSDMTEQLFKKEIQLKANVIESSIRNPEPMPSNGEALINEFVERYQKMGGNPEDLVKIADLESLSPEEGCRIGVSFSKALADKSEFSAKFYKAFVAAE